jgi:transposase
MQLVEQHVISKTDPRYAALDRAAFASKNLYNAALYVQLPHTRFIDMLCYKAKLVGIQVIVQEESYTSKASFLDLDPIPTYGKEEGEPVFRGRRIKRGMYKASDKRKINADINGSYNIMRKASPNVFRSNGVEDGKGVLASLVVHPVRIVVPVRTQKVSGQ